MLYNIILYWKLCGAEPSAPRKAANNHMNDLLTDLLRTAAALPEKTAVADGETRYTFSELRALAAGLGSALLRRSNGGAPVGVLVERSVDTAAELFAALWAGAPYVPLDPTLPQEKMRTILADAGVVNLLGRQEHRALAAELGLPLLTPAEADADPLPPQPSDPDAPYCLVYTSGSTGRPKGVVKSHAAMGSFLDAFLARFRISPDEIIGNQTPFFFDAAAKDLYLMSRLGCTLEIIPAEKFIFPVRLIEYLNERSVSYVCWVPTALSIVTALNTFRQILPRTLRRVFFVGESFPIKELHKWLEALPELDYVNLYGQTELAGICCYYEIPRGEKPERLPMGQPLGNCRVWLHGEGGFVTAPDEVGELWVESPALALGYHGDPEKTAAVFAVETLPDGSRARVLKTGDLAQYDAAGMLVFRSRSDYQIKHMGRRIELGEIEAVTDKLPQIARCCCLYNDEKKRIELFCSLAEGEALTGREVQSLLRGRLSDYMLPSRVHVLDALPLNQNGKLDRRALRQRM